MIQAEPTQVCIGCGQRKPIKDFAVTPDRLRISKHCDNCAPTFKKPNKKARHETRNSIHQF